MSVAEAFGLAVIESDAVAPGSVVIVDAAWQQQVYDALGKARMVVKDGPPVAVSGLKLWEIRFGFEPAPPMRAVWE